MAISLEAYFTDRRSGVDRRYKFASEFTNEVQVNAEDLIKRINKFLAELGVITSQVSSGWRPPSLNAKISNAAKKSHHMTGKAVDLVDSTGELGALIVKKEEWLEAHGQPSLLEKHGLWLENPNVTPGWVHLDTGTRSPRPIRIFNP